MEIYRYPGPWWVCSLALVCFLAIYPARASASPDTSAAITVTTSQGKKVEPGDAWTALAQADVVYLGETHSNPQDHQAQLTILQTLHQQRSRLAIGMEMFQRPYQNIVDRYLAGEITEAQLQELSQYRQRWGFPWELYAPILRFAKENHLPVLALNTPTEVTRKVARQGPESLTWVDRRFIPPLSSLDTGNGAYRARIQTVFEQIHQGRSHSSNFENFFLAQVLWDETMAEGISQFLQRQPGTQVVVLAGKGHIFYGDGIPSRVQRRWLQSHQRPLKQSLVLLNPPADLLESLGGGESRPVADYLWYGP